MTPEQYDREIANKFEAFLLRQVRDKNIPASDTQQIRHAFEYAKNAHKDMVRKSGEPYIAHPLEVARIVAEEMGMFTTSIISAFLHDVVEDNKDISIEDIRSEFGNVVANITDGLTKIAKLPVVDENKSLQSENFRRILLTIADDIRVILIKIADRLHNMRTLGAMRDEKRLKIASETMYLYAPLAHRLGLYNIKSELEDLALMHLDRNAYLEISQKLEETKEDAKMYIDRFTRKISERLEPSGLKFTIKSRYKSIFSIYNKIKNKGVPFEEVFDLYAIRIILETRPDTEIEDCYQVYTLIGGLYPAHASRLRDWLRLPKENGYQALHTTVYGPEGKPVEVQIRTQRMDELAEKGPTAAHWKYKGGVEETTSDEFLTEFIEQIRAILENPSYNAMEAVREVRANIKMDALYVFTPKGQAKRIPNNATVLDFAYYVHTKIGNHAIGAKVNQQVVPLQHILKQGDVIEVLTSQKQQPKEEWLRIAQTFRARTNIKESLKLQRKEWISKGKEIFERGVQRLNITAEHPIMNDVLKFFRLQSREDFFYNLGMHSIELRQLLPLIRLYEEGKPILPPEEKKVKEDTTPIDSDSLVLGKNMDIDKLSISNCCNPVPGDDIMAFQQKKRVYIHRTSCEKAISLMANFGSQIIKAHFAEGTGISFLTAIKVEGLDKKGILMEILGVITQKMTLNMRKVTIDAKDGLFEGLFLVYIKDKNELNELISRILEIAHVSKVTRTDSNFQPFKEEGQAIM